MKTIVNIAINTAAVALAFAIFPALAAAEIKFSGEAKMGLRHFDGETSFAAGTRATARFSGITDGGLEYGATIDLDQTGSGLDPVFRNDPQRVQVYISGGNHSLRVGKGTRNATQSLMD